MPTAGHIERHFTASAAVRDIVIGMADGLTVPFALAAGLTGAVAATANASGIIVTAGVAEIAAGSIAMGLGGYLAAKTDSEHYESEKEREIRETDEIPDQEEEEVAKVFRGYGMTEAQLRPVVSAICGDKQRWVDFMMRFELGLEPPDPARAGRSAATIAGSYIAGGLIPLAPYILAPYLFGGSIEMALWVSVGVTILALFVFGSVKGHYTGVHPWRGGLQTVLVGGLAAAAAFFIARLIKIG